MLYPKAVVQYVQSRPHIKELFPNIANLDNANVSSNSLDQESNAFTIYMLTDGYNESRAIRKYLHFLATTYDTFNEIYRYFPKQNTESTHKDDISSIGTAPSELFYHAMYIYCLDSWGVEGEVIECGTFKGFSACCLSWVCDYLGKQLIVADSFEGLPYNTTDTYYKKGDFCGRIDEVRANIEDFGKIDTVQFIQGFYDESLKGFDTPVCMIWMDVDLYESATEILKNLFMCLSAGGVIISHELFEERDFENRHLKPTIGPSKALHSFFSQNSINYQAMPLENGSGLVVPCQTENKLVLSPAAVQSVRDNCRLEDLRLGQQQAEFKRDIHHWQNEVDKLLTIYRSTADFKIKNAVKSILGKLGISNNQKVL